MLTPTQGKNKFILFRTFENRNVEAARLALQTDHEIGETQTMTTLQTKDGEIIIPGGLATRISISAVVSNDPLTHILREAVREGKLLEIWEIDLGFPLPPETTTDGDGTHVVPGTENRYLAQYGTGYLSSWTTPSPVAGFSTISTEFYVIGKLIPGPVQITPEQQEEINAAFVDITPIGDDPEEGS